MSTAEICMTAFLTFDCFIVFGLMAMIWFRRRR